MKKLYKETNMWVWKNHGELNVNCEFIQIEKVDDTLIYEYIEKPYDKLTPIEATKEVGGYDFVKIPNNKITLIDEPLIKESQPDESVKDVLPASAVDVTNIKITKEQLVQLIYNNFYDKSINTIDLVGLDFRNLKCDVAISELKIGGSLYQLNQEIGGSLYQVNQEISGNLWQDKQVIGGDLDQTGQVVKGRIVPTEKE